LPPPQAEVPARRQQARLITRFTVERDDAARWQRRAKTLDHQTRMVLGDDPRAKKYGRYRQRRDPNQNKRKNQKRRDGHRISFAANTLSSATEERVHRPSLVPSAENGLISTVFLVIVIEMTLLR
jgi:plasmid stabilization system protein ParE